MPKVNIEGFYKREKDKTEYIHYSEGETEYLTNGVFVWKEGIREKIETLKKVNDINIVEMKMRLKRYLLYAHITNILQGK